MENENDIEISLHKSEDGTRTAKVKKKDDKYVVVFNDEHEGYSVVKKYSHLQLAEDQAEDWVL